MAVPPSATNAVGLNQVEKLWRLTFVSIRARIWSQILLSIQFHPKTAENGTFPQCFPQLWKSWGTNRSTPSGPCSARSRRAQIESGTVAQRSDARSRVDTPFERRLVLRVPLDLSGAHI